MRKEDIARMIDHTLLKPDACLEQLEKLCFEAIEHNFATVCVNPTHVEFCASILKDKAPQVCTVVGFPLGANISGAKAFETKEAICLGAEEIDMVINIGALKDQKFDFVKADIESVVNAAGQIPVKVIIETSLLNDEQKIKACMLAKQAGASFVKTSTGFSGGGANAHDVALMRKTVGENIGVKASGGIRTYEDAIAVINAGANRIGASSGVNIIKGQSQKADQGEADAY